MNVFYSKEIEGHKITLRDQEAIHCSKVLRKKQGTQIQVVDGNGGRYVCAIDEIHRQSVVLRVIQSTQIATDDLLPHIAFGLIKNTSRLEWLLEKITEVGIRRITPIICARSERDRINHDRLTKILISAMKQSMRSYLPELDHPVQLREFLAHSFAGQQFIASYGEGVPELEGMVQASQPSTVLIGPEGDFTPDEVQLSEQIGFIRVNLGNFRLRAETASLVATTIINYSRS